MYRVHLEREIAVSHILEHHKGKCRRLHGHNLLVTVDVYRTYTNSQGMLIDFGDIKGLVDSFDHRHLNDHELIKKYNWEQDPTAERLCKILVDELDLLDHFANIKVRVQEAQGQWAEYSLKND